VWNACSLAKRLSIKKRAKRRLDIYATCKARMSESALSTIADDSQSSRSADTDADVAVATSKPFWPAAVASHADAALDLLAALNIPDHSVGHDAALAVDRIRANADAACADDLRNTQQHVHHAYAHAEHSPELAVRVATLDAAAAWRLAQYLYEAHANAVPAAADLEHRMQQHCDDRLQEVYGMIQVQMQNEFDSRLVKSSIASLNLHRKHEQQIQDLQLALTDLQEKHDALKEEFAGMQARAKPPTRKWSLFSAADANAFASITP